MIEMKNTWFADGLAAEDMQDAELYLERFALAAERIQELHRLRETADLPEAWQRYIGTMSLEISRALEIVSDCDEGLDNGFDGGKQPPAYVDYIDGDQAKAALGDTLGPYFSCSAYLLSWIRYYKEQKQPVGCLIHMELFLELLSVLKNGAEDGHTDKTIAHNLKQTLYYFLSDYAKLHMEAYLGYWFAQACGYTLEGYYAWATGADEVIHQAHKQDLALFLNHNLKDRILYGCHFWEKQIVNMKPEPWSIGEPYHNKQQKLLVSFREALMEGYKEAEG